MKTATFILIFLLSTNFVYTQWEQLGQGFEGEEEYEWIGKSVSISGDGLTIAMGADGNDINGTDAGRVVSYKYIDGNWVQLGDVILGEGAHDNSGCSVSLSKNGEILAIGASSNNGNGNGAGHVRVFRYLNNDWVQIGNDIDGDAVKSFSGCSVDLSSDGYTVVIGAFTKFVSNQGSLTGEVKVYRYINDDWQQLGEAVTGKAAIDQFGFSVSLNDKGDIFASGSQNASEDDIRKGRTRIFKYEADKWVQLGQDIYGKEISEYAGYSVSLSSDGLTVATSSLFGAGKIRIYNYNDNVWNQKGDDILGYYTGRSFGYSVSLDSSGNRVVVGAPSEVTGSPSPGYVNVFQFEDNEWVRYGNDLYGEMNTEQFGRAVCISSNGNTLVVGAPYNSNNLNHSGKVRVFKYNPISSVFETQKEFGLDIYPNPSTGNISLQFAEKYLSNEISIVDVLGQVVHNFEITKESMSVDLSKFTKGIYYFHIKSSSETIIEKIILE